MAKTKDELIESIVSIPEQLEEADMEDELEKFKDLIEAEGRKKNLGKIVYEIDIGDDGSIDIEEIDNDTVSYDSWNLKDLSKEALERINSVGMKFLERTTEAKFISRRKDEIIDLIEKAQTNPSQRKKLIVGFNQKRIASKLDKSKNIPQDWRSRLKDGNMPLYYVGKLDLEDLKYIYTFVDKSYF